MKSDRFPAMSNRGLRAERISGMDAWQLYQETDLQVGNGVCLMVLDRSSVDGDVCEHLIREVGDRLHLLPVYTKVLFDPWYNIDRSMLVPTTDVDLRRHITRLAMPDPGGLAGAAKAFADIRGRHLDRSEPLWHTYVIEEAGSNLCYLVSLVHHLLVGGDAAMDVVGALFIPGDVSGTPARPVDPDNTFEPRLRSVVADGFRRKATRLRRLPSLLRTTLRTRRIDRAHRRHSPTTPRTALNCTLSGESTVALTVLPFDSMVEVAHAQDVTVNHVLLSCVGRALRMTLQEDGRSVDRPLVAAVPFAMRDADQSDYITEGVGSTTILRIGMCDDIADPVERLTAIAVQAREAKEAQERRGVNLFRQWNEYIPGKAVSTLFRMIERFGLAENIDWPCNAIVSNASGMTLDGVVYANLPARQCFGAGPLYHGMGPSIFALNWNGEFCIAVTADRKHVRHADLITERIDQQFTELLTATRELQIRERRA